MKFILILFPTTLRDLTRRKTKDYKGYNYILIADSKEDILILLGK